MNNILGFFGAVVLAKNLYFYILNLNFIIRPTFYRHVLRYYITRKLNAIEFAPFTLQTIIY